jgi:two-component system OmpR family response regulator
MARGLRFTLADDDEKFLFLVHHLLSRAFPGASIASFSDPGDALHHILDVGTDILITDHGMGQMTGTELIRKLRKHGSTIPIIMVSGDSNARQEAQEVGANEFLHKDIALKELLGQVKRFLLV